VAAELVECDGELLGDVLLHVDGGQAVEELVEIGRACLGLGHESGRAASDKRIFVGAGGVEEFACVRTEVRAEVVGALQRSVADG
jgi:hypothetical protein